MPLSDRDILKRIHAFFREKGITLSLAESCTGGLIASMITDLAGASEFFDSGVITYSEGSKSDILAVESIVMMKHGVVSRETARQMAEGVRRIRKTDYSLAVTGNLGPSTAGNGEVGLVCFAVATPRGTETAEVKFNGTRRQVKRKAAIHALRFLAAHLEP